MDMTRTKYLRRYNALKAERDPYMNYWRNISDSTLGHKGRFLSTDKNRNIQRNNTILNNTARLAARTLAGGMMAGITSPARPWFRLAPPDTEMMENENIKAWLYQVEKLMREVFNKSNFYNTMHSLYSELGVFATAAIGIYPDEENVIHCQNYTIGSYCLGVNGRNYVDSFYREFTLTVGACIKEYGKNNCSEMVQNLWKNGGSEKDVTIVHLVEPNDDRDGMKANNRNMKYRSVHFEKEAKGHEGFLRESGNPEYPILTPRWDVTGQDPYGSNCPAMDALGDTRALQLEEKRKAQAIDKVVNPPLQAPVSMQNQIEQGGFRSGDISFVNDMSQGGIKSIYDMRPDLNALAADIQNNEFRVKRAFYEDLFLMLANSDRRQITAREVEEKHEEKLLMLGPVLERLHNELLDPLIDRVFALMDRAGRIPPAPQELQGSSLRVEYISVLAQAQRMTAIGGIERLSGYVAQLSQIYPDARHKLDAHQTVDEYAEALGVSPKLVVDDDDVDKILAEEAEQAQQAQAMQMADPIHKMAQTAKLASETDMSGSDTALDKIAGMA